jgi:uncharacterized RDD family membrane protein YckC
MAVEPINPYAPPQAALEVASPIADVDRVIASRNRRFWGYVIDASVLALLTWVALELLVRLNWWVPTPRPKGWAAALKASLDPVSWVQAIVFYFFFEKLLQITPGKLLLGMRVVSADGLRPSAAAIFLRTMVRMIPFEGLSIFSETRTCWHDRWSSTRVISLEKLRSLENGTLAVEEAEVVEALRRENRPADWHTMSEAKRAVWEMQQQAANKE